MIYTPKQRALMRLWQKNKLKRINILEGSVSSGKTWISLVLWAFWVHEMPDDPDHLYLMSARSLTTLKRNCLLLLQSLVGESNFKFSISAKEGWLFGRHILLEGANDAQAESKIRGLTLQGAYCDEATKLPQDFFAMLLSRLRKPGAKLFCTTNPDYPGHWLKVDYIDRQDELDLLDMRFTLDDNTTLPQDYVDNIKLEYTGVFYDRFILGLWVLAEGLIFPMYQQVIVNTIPDEKPLKTAFSVDYGTMNAFAMLQWNLYGNKWIAVKGYYYSGRETGVQKTDAEYLQDIERRFADVIDYTRQNRMKTVLHEKLEVIIDPSAASFIALLHKTDWAKVHKADNDVLNGIRETATAMNLKLFGVYAGVKEFAQEAGGYVWDDRSLEERPVKENDHCLTGDTLVCTSDGKKRIDELVGKSGYVLSYNTKSRKAEYKRFYSVRMTQKAAKVYKITTENGDVVRCTADHPVLTKRGYVCAGNLQNGDEILYIMDAMRYNKRKTPKRRLIAWLSTRMMDWLRMLMV